MRRATTSAEPQRAIGELQSRLDAVYADRPGPELADRALACVVQRHAIPRTLLDALQLGHALFRMRFLL